MKKYIFLLLFFLSLKLYCSVVEYTVVKGDCLWNIAKQYYNNPFLWREIYAANKEKIKNPDLIYPGQVFILPRLKYEYEEKISSSTSIDIPQEKQEKQETIKTEMLTLEQIFEQQKISVSSSVPVTTEAVVEELEFELPLKINLENFVSYGKIVDGKEKKFVYIDYDIVFCKFNREVSIGDIFGIYHLGPSLYDVNLMNVPNNQLTLVGRLKIIEVKDNNIGVGEILRIFSPVTIGDMLSRIEHKKK